MDSIALMDRLAPSIVGRRREVELLVAGLAAGRHVVLEGPPGTGKSSMLRAVAHELGIGFELVEGNAELTPARLVGHFDPALVLADGYQPDAFVDGPLVASLRAGALLYIEELNRVPEETLNVLVTVMSERELTVPRLGRIVAEPGFRLVAAMNPFDAIGTARISAAISDRVCRIAVGYQSADDEVAIVQRHTPTVDAAGWPRPSSSCAAPARITTSASARRCAARSICARSRRPSPNCAGAPSTTRASASMQHSPRCRVASGCARGVRAMPTRSSPSSGTRSSARLRRRRRTAREKRSPRRGRRRRAEPAGHRR
jgi:Mg-chelatase subunit ChlI